VALRFSTFNLYLDNAGNAIDTSVDISNNNLWLIQADQWAAAGAGNITNQTFAQLSSLAPAQITVDQDNYAPTGIATAASLLINSSAAKNITGLLAPQRAAATITITNIGNFAITLKQNSASSTAGNRFILKGGVDAALASDSGITLVYGSGAWREVVR